MEGNGRRVVVTGIGVVAPCGIGKEAFWDGLLRPVDGGRSHRAIADFDPADWFSNPKEARRADRFSQFAMAAATMALADAGSEPAGDPGRKGVILATGIGGLHTLEDQIQTRLEKGERRVSPFLVPMMMANAGGAGISMRFGWQGPCETITTACAASTHAIGYAARLIAWGRCDAVLAGGAESTLTPTAIAGFRNMTALSSVGVSMPFDVRRDGFVMSEAASVLLLEELELGTGPRRHHPAARCSVPPATPTPTTSPRRRPVAAARSRAWSFAWRTPACDRRTSSRSTPTARRRR